MMLISEEAKSVKIEFLKRNLVLGVSGGSLELIESISNHYSLPSDTTIYDRVFMRNHLIKMSVGYLIDLFKDIINEIDVSTSKCEMGGVVLNHTPIDAISILLLHLNRFNLSSKEQKEANAIIESALNLCSNFSFFVQVFPNAKERTLSTDLLANLKNGVYNRYYERLGCTVIQVSESLQTNESRSEFIFKIVDHLIEVRNAINRLKGY